MLNFRQNQSYENYEKKMQFTVIVSPASAFFHALPLKKVSS